MSSIEQYLQSIRTAILAKIVRRDIANAIEQCYDDVHNPTLNTEAIQAAVQAKIDAGQMAALTIGDRTITAAKLALGVIPTPDTTLSQSGIPADAKTAGDEITAIKADLGDVNESLGAVDETVTTTSEAVELCVVKSIKPKPEPTEITQCVDLTTATRSQSSGGSYIYLKVKIECPWLGAYYHNPTGTEAYLYRLHAFDANGNQLQLYRGGESWPAINTVVAGGYFEKIDARTIVTYRANGTVENTYTADGDIAYLGGDSDAKLYTVSSVLTDQYGVTYGGSSSSYIPYGDSGSSDETPDEYEYTYNTEMLTATKDYVVENYTDSEPTKGSDNLITSDGVASYLLKSTRNLMDYSKISWTLVSGKYSLVAGYYFPVTAGTVITTNVEKVYYTFYDEDYTQVATSSYTLAKSPVTVPDGASWARIAWIGNETSNYGQNAEGYYPVSVWECESALSAPYENPHTESLQRIKGSLLGGDLFTYAAPDGMPEVFCRWLRYATIRTMNECREAYRFGTFNVFVTKKKELSYPKLRDIMLYHGLDFCGFQECEQSGAEMSAALTSWQFPYNSGSRYSSADRSPCVGRFEVISVDTVILEEANYHSLKIMKMYLPRNKHYRKATLTVYNYHASLTASKRIEEAQTILGLIQNDDSDFKIVMADTNDPSTTTKASWDVYENGGLTAVHHGESPTFPSDETAYNSIDNIFVSEHINVLHYDIVRMGTGEYVMLDGSVNVSDHDMVFADLQFDFDAVLANSWTQP